MKNLKYIIILLIVLIIIVIVSLLLIINHKTSEELENQQNEYLDVLNNPGYSIIGKKPELTELNNIYFTIDACIQKTIKYLQEEENEAVYNLLDKEYVQKNNITKENMQSKLKLNEVKSCKTKEVYELVGTNYASYYVKSKTNNSNIYFNINWDIEKASFNISIITQSEFENYINKVIGQEDVKKEEKSIERNEYNSIPYKYLEEADVAKRYFEDYINNAINFPEEIYNYLDKEYREKKFGNVQNFKQYVSNNEELQKLYKSANANVKNYNSGIEYFIAKDAAQLEKYSRQEKEGYTQYTCIDTFGNYYIFKVTFPMQYTVILDTYTIDIPEFTEKYNKSNEQEKVILNLNKFMLAINDGDYKYAYGVLADSFKANNFPSYESFVTYAKANFFQNNKFDYLNFGNEAGTYYTYKVKVRDGEEAQAKVITKTFIMLLGEGTDFQMSFDV